jgi:hypothetical protein
MNRIVVTLSLALAFFASLSSHAVETPVPGQKSAIITCQKQEKFSYIMYFPKSYDPARSHKWPVMFVLSPGGGSARTLDCTLTEPSKTTLSWLFLFKARTATLKPLLPDSP